MRLRRFKVFADLEILEILEILKILELKGFQEVWEIQEMIDIWISKATIKLQLVTFEIKKKLS